MRIAMIVLAAAAAQTFQSETWNFSLDETGKIARGFEAKVGTWRIEELGGNRVLAQQAKNEDEVFNVAFVAGSSACDCELSVRLKAVSGAFDQGGGLVWRARDEKNYYITRYNPLEDNFRLYKVEAGVRTQLATCDIKGDRAWHTLRVTMSGSHIECFMDGVKKLEANDGAFKNAGKVGLWTKSDAHTLFDDLTLTRKL